MKEEHYEAQAQYAELLFRFLNIRWWHPLDKYWAWQSAENFRKLHTQCCDWANEIN